MVLGLYAAVRMKAHSVFSPAGATATINLSKLQQNYSLLARKAKKAACAVAIKGDAYGLGIAPVAAAFWKSGCRSFYVARPEEGAVLRGLLPRATITILDGLYDGHAGFYRKYKLVPALTTLSQIQDWAKHGKGFECALHVDTGINRAGLQASEWLALTGDDELLRRLNIRMLMSHLACGDDKDSPMNQRQLDRFTAIRKALPHIPASFANSPSIFLRPAYHFDEVRPGVALYGGNPTPYQKNPMKPVVTLEARILQIRNIHAGDTVGYSATWKAKRPSRIAVIAAGYADGVARKLSSRQPNGPAQVYLGGQRCPIVGRVSMDMMTVDVTDVPERKLASAEAAELFGAHISVDEAAGWAGTISYELLTHLGKRYARVYVA
jgi:alanine racemase